MRSPMLPPEASSLARAQHAFAAHLRDPERHAAPADVPDRRMQAYRELVHGNVESLVATNFPVLRSIHSDADWHARIRDFLAHHVAKTPLFTRLGLEWLDYLSGERARFANEPPYLLELARHEWLETELAICEEEALTIPVDPTADLVEDVPVLSPLVRWLRAEWPVHRISASWQPRERPERETCLVLCRDAEFEIRFMELTPQTLRLIELLAESPDATGRTLLERLARELGVADRSRFVETGRAALEALQQRAVLLGARRREG